MVRNQPELTMSDIARVLDISRERVRQIVAGEGLTVRRGHKGIGERTPRPPGPPMSRVQTGGVAVPISHTVAGTIGELMAAADLTARGFVVFFPLVRTAQCDLVALDREGNVQRIEVRCGHRGQKGRVVYSQKDRSRTDRYAIVITGEPIVYDPPLP